jgi:hypothetical protein
MIRDFRDFPGITERHSSIRGPLPQLFRGTAGRPRACRRARVFGSNNFLILALRPFTLSKTIAAYAAAYVYSLSNKSGAARLTSLHPVRIMATLSSSSRISSMSRTPDSPAAPNAYAQALPTKHALAPRQRFQHVQAGANATVRKYRNLVLNGVDNLRQGPNRRCHAIELPATKRAPRDFRAGPDFGR